MNLEKNKFEKESANYGFSILEMLVSVAIISLIGLAVANFQKDIFSLNTHLQDSLSAQLDARKVLRSFIAEVRSASPSSLGGYAIESAGTSSITFYSNIDNDLYKERLRYFLQGSDLKRGVIKPGGNPLVYNPSDEEFDIIARDVVNGTNTPIFDYFDKNFYGTTTPLTSPVDPILVRLIRMTLVIDRDPNKSPEPINVSSQGTLRNLKDNL